ncbi:hypothetical protein CR513_20888, partial [Mucuna pruriens]
MENSPQIFWEQPFSQEIDETQVPPNFREVVVEPFDGTQDPHAHLQAFQTQMHPKGCSDEMDGNIPGQDHSNLNDLASAFAS